MEQGIKWSTLYSVFNLVYLDDIILFTKEKLRDVFSRLKWGWLKIKPTKCPLLQTSVHYLGHVVTTKGVETDHGKMKCLSGGCLIQGTS